MFAGCNLCCFAAVLSGGFRVSDSVHLSGVCASVVLISAKRKTVSGKGIFQTDTWLTEQLLQLEVHGRQAVFLH